MSRQDDPALVLPPHNLSAERQVLSALMMPEGREAMDFVAPLLGVEDFYRESHQALYRVLLEQYEAGRPLDAVSVAEVLERRGEYARLGGDAALAEIAGAAPHAANAHYHAQMVRENAKLRELIGACQQTIADAYRMDQPADAVIALASTRIADIEAGAGGGEAVPVADVVEELRSAVEARRQGEVPGVATGFRALDELLKSGMPNGGMVVIAGRPGSGKSAFALSVCDRACVRMKTAVLFVSLEMGRLELVERLVVMRAPIAADRLKHAWDLRDEDWGRFGRASVEIGGAPLFIDDAPVASAQRIAALSRRMARRGVGLVVVDYLQLIDGSGDGDRGASRQEVVAKISRRMKTLARELGVPVVLLCQLNREVERREDHRPRLADLRECLAADTTIYDSHTGAMRTVGDYIRSGHSLVGYSLDVAGPANPCRVYRTIGERFWSTGIKPVFRVRTATGRVVRCTANHPFLTIAGWKPLESLRSGDRVAAPRVLPEPMAAHHSIGIHPDEARLVGYLISDGSYLKHRTVGYVKADRVLVDDVRRIVRERFGIEARDKPCKGIAEQIELTGPQAGPGCNPVIEWLKRLGIHGQKGHEKRVPAAVLSARNDVVAEFLGSLWAGDGCVTRRKSGGWCLKFTSTSMDLLREVQMLLLRFEVISVLANPGRNTKSTRDIATLSIHDSRQIVRFHTHIKLPGVKGDRLDRAAADCLSLDENSHIDRMPHHVGVMVASAKADAGHSWSTLGYRVQGKEMHRDTLAWVAEKVRDNELAALAASEVLWDRVVSIDPDGEEEVYDVRVPSMGNFVAGGIFVHNSGAIEQDADIVILLHRPEYYDPNDQPGVAEAIVAKQRNGGIGTARLEFVKERAEFRDIDPTAGAIVATGDDWHEQYGV